MNAIEIKNSLFTIVRKEIIRINRIWPQTVLPSAIMMTLYFVIFGAFIGSQIRNINGFSYMAFIVPGIIMMSVITNAYMNVTSSFFSSKFVRSVEELMVSPTPNWVILVGYVLGGMYRGLLNGIVVMIVSLFFTKLSIFSIWMVLLYILLTSIVFSLGGFVNSIYAKKFDDISIIPTFVLTPLTYLGGVFYPLSVLPPIWQKISLLNPIVYMIDGFRYGFLGIADISVFVGLSILCVFTVVLFMFNLYLLKKGVGLRN